MVNIPLQYITRAEFSSVEVEVVNRGLTIPSTVAGIASKGGIIFLQGFSTLKIDKERQHIQKDLPVIGSVWALYDN